jgi:hypothetical protein
LAVLREVASEAADGPAEVPPLAELAEDVAEPHAVSAPADAIAAARATITLPRVRRPRICQVLIV